MPLAVVGFAACPKTKALAKTNRRLPVVYIDTLIGGFDLYVQYHAVGMPQILDTDKMGMV